MDWLWRVRNPYIGNIYVFLSFVMEHSRRWQLQKGGCKMSFFCRISMSSEYMRVRTLEAKNVFIKMENIQKMKFSKKFFKRASLKSGNSEICHHKYNKKRKIRGKILSHQQPLCYLSTHHHSNSAIKLINLRVSCSIKEHLRWRNRLWLLACQSPYYSEVHTFIIKAIDHQKLRIIQFILIYILDHISIWKFFWVQ